MTTPCELRGAARWESPSALLISDLHLSPQSPLAMRAFCRLLGELSRPYESLLVLGDLFEVYAGDDALQNDAFVAQVAAALKDASQHCRIGLMHGNRDFLIGQTFCDAAGATLLADPCVLHDTAGSAPLLLSHGDAWCTLDTAYQTKKLEIRSPQWQKKLLTMTWTQRWALANGYREQSMAQRSSGQAAVDLALYDVDPAAFQTACLAHDVQQGLHGHTHAPAQHGGAMQRTVLGDWQFDASAMHGSDRPPPQAAIVGVWQSNAVALQRYDGAVLTPWVGAL